MPELKPRVVNRSQAGVAQLSRIWQFGQGPSEALVAPNTLQAVEMVLVRILYLADLPTPSDLVKTLQAKVASPPSPPMEMQHTPQTAPADQSLLPDQQPPTASSSKIPTKPHADLPDPPMLTHDHANSQPTSPGDPKSHHRNASRNRPNHPRNWHLGWHITSTQFQPSASTPAATAPPSQAKAIPQNLLNWQICFVKIAK